MIYVLSRHTMYAGQVMTEVVGAFEEIEDAQDIACHEEEAGLEWHKTDDRKHVWWAMGAVKLVAYRINGVEVVRRGAQKAPQLPLDYTADPDPLPMEEYHL